MHSFLTPDLQECLAELSACLLERGWRCATAESCTGGLIGAALTALPGSSAWYQGGVVAYANAIKTSLLDVPEDVLALYGAVSEQSARQMAVGACRRLGVEAAMSVTGIAGPDGGSPGKPVGTVWLGWAWRERGGHPSLERSLAERHVFAGGRDAVRAAAALESLAGIVRMIKAAP